MKIQMNMSKLDRSVRITGSALLIYIGFVNPGLVSNHVINILLGCFGLLNLISAMIGFCPLYHLANLSTHRGNTPGQN